MPTLIPLSLGVPNRLGPPTRSFQCVMSTENETPSFDDLPESEVSNNDGGSNWIDLEPGDEVSGYITGFNPEAGRNGVVEIDGCPMYLTAGMRQRLIAELVEGSIMGVRVSEEEESFTNDDGEEVTYNPKEARFQ